MNLLELAVNCDEDLNSHHNSPLALEGSLHKLKLVLVSVPLKSKRALRGTGETRVTVEAAVHW